MNYPSLENAYVRLIPLRPEHFELLLPLSIQVDLYMYGPSDISTPDKLKAYIHDAFAKAKQGSAQPYIIYDKTKKAYAGSTRFGHMDTNHKTLHIGWTWLGTDFRGSGINTHIKYLMLDYAFTAMDMEKVAFRIDERNMRSRKAVEKLGATLEGILRQNLIVKNGFRRSTACYSILKSEWPKIKTTFFKSI
ncbi:MAG: GNAT family protein [Dokdonia sp.]|jgi:RimJ/RimL family protein N-acetyltransferase|nr:GNAT family N-acetyltransferase [Cytophagaceae bacterium]